MQSSLYIPKFDINVVLTFKNNKFLVDYIPESCYTEKEIKKEVIKIIKEMAKTI